MLDPKLDSKKQEHKEARVQVHEEDMEIGYEDNPSPLSFEGLEHKFLDEITKLVKEQSDAEDVENTRHREVCKSVPMTAYLKLTMKIIKKLEIRNPWIIRQKFIVM